MQGRRGSDMKTFLFLFVGVIASIVLLATLGPLILLGISIAIAYYALKKFILSDSTGGKVGWALVGITALVIALSNTAAFVGALAFVMLYYIYKSWKQDKTKTQEDEWVME